MKACGALSILICLVLVAGTRFPANAQPAVARGEGSEGSSGSPITDDLPGSGGGADMPAMPFPAGEPLITPVLPVVKTPDAPEVEGGVKWGQLSRASLRFLAIQHAFRLYTEAGTREGLKGSFIQNYGRSVANLHGWADGDEFYVNYVGHPMQGSVTGFMWLQNDPAYNRAVFGKDPLYWKGRLRAAAFMWAYSAQFEIGPVSEASIGAIQSQFPQQGFVDHVITPALGMAWMIGEDVLDRYVIEPIEARTTNRLARVLVRGIFNPSRTFSNVMNAEYAWSRTSRAGICSYTRPVDPHSVSARPSATRMDPGSLPDTALAPPFEFDLTFRPEGFWGRGKSVLCLGGGADTAFRLAPSWQLVAQVGGCKMLGLEENLSGDSLTYSVGPRWLTRIHGPWTANLQFLVGGAKITEERMFPELKKVLEAGAIRDNAPPPSHGDYTEETESHGFTVAMGGGVSYQLNKALIIRVADVSYRHGWTSPLWGRDYSNSLTVSSGLVLRMGTW
jgi:hypothetical protein